MVATSHRTRLSWVPDFSVAAGAAVPEAPVLGAGDSASSAEMRVTKASPAAPARDGWRGLLVGKSAELVEPTTTGVAAPVPTAMPAAWSSSRPPR